ncbi:glycosyltransferase [Rhizobium sp. YIM 134829]|uniref:glycosyltransferase n=1 Tax=Rhizobium sp. YIM 134829 TaxID=3390453 RepID=UPI00397902CB
MPSSHLPPRRIVVISDFQDGSWSDAPLADVETMRQEWMSGSRGMPLPVGPRPDEVEVDGGYIERLPLACVKAGLVETAEIWTHWRGETPPPAWTRGSPHLLRRAFRMNGPQAPFSSNDMLGHIEAFGPPEILCVWGLGVSEEIMEACRDSIRIYNSIDAPALRIPPEVSRHFDLVLTGAEWQSEAVRARHPDMQTAIMPVGPEFASKTTFRPLGLPKIYDIIYVAAAQAYKRHDILFDALARLPRNIRALCVCGYGELADAFRARITELGLSVEIIGPPGVAFDEVNRLMNQSRLGVVCGVDDGAPAILTEYMLAGIPVLANSALTCGLQYITPDTGRAAPAEQFGQAIAAMLAGIEAYAPRQTVLDRWTWPHTIALLRPLIEDARRKK